MKNHRFTTVSAAIVLLALPSLALADGGSDRPSGPGRDAPAQTTPAPTPKPAPSPGPAPSPSPKPVASPKPTPPRETESGDDDDRPQGTTPRRDDRPQGTTPRRDEAHESDDHADAPDANEKRKAYGLACAGLSKRRVAGERRTPFSICVRALAKLDDGRADDPARACKGLSKKRTEGKRKPSAFKRCVAAAAPYDHSDDREDRDESDDRDHNDGAEATPTPAPTPAPTPSPAPAAS